MPKNAKPLPDITPEQHAIVEANWHQPPDVLLRLVWPDRPELTCRCVEWKKVRTILAGIGKDPGGPGSGPQAKSATGPVEQIKELTTAQIEFLAASYKDANGPMELTRTLFNDERIMPGDHRVKLVVAAVRKLDPTYRRYDEEAEDIDYQAPKTTLHLMGRLNRYGIGQRADGKRIGDGGVEPQEQRNLEALLRYMRRPVFKAEADKFSKKIDREVFEEVFLSSCWGKTDLSSEHELQYILLASVTSQRNYTDRMVRMLDDRFVASLEDAGRPLGKGEVDALKEMKDKASEHLKQVGTLIKTLTGERKNIADAQRAGSASMHPLVSAWKYKVGREKALLVAKKYNDELKTEVTRLAGMDALKVELFGLNPDLIAL